MRPVKAKLIHIEIKFTSPREYTIYADREAEKSACRGEAGLSCEGTGTGSRSGVDVLRELLLKVLLAYPHEEHISLCVNDKNRIVLDEECKRKPA